MEILNLTPHPINYYEDDTLVKSIPTSKEIKPLRLSSSFVKAGYLKAFRLIKSSYGDVDLPIPTSSSKITKAGIAISAGDVLNSRFETFPKPLKK